MRFGMKDINKLLNNVMPKKDSSLRKDASTVGLGLAAGAAGYGAAKLFDKSNHEAAAAGAVTAGVASLLAHLINKKLSERHPILSPVNAGIAATAAGAGTSAASLGVMNVLKDKLGPTVSSAYSKALDAIAPSASTQQRTQNFIRTGIRDTHDDIVNSYQKWVAGIAREANRVPNQLDPSKPGKLIKLLNATLKNKRKAASLVLGAAAIPSVYNFIRGNGSD